MRLGEIVFAIAAIAAGVLNLMWGEFEAAHQPVQAWGNHLPGISLFAYIAAIWLIAAGAALLWRPTARVGAAALAILYGIFILFPLPRLYSAPHFLGHHFSVYIGVLVSVCQQIILFLAAIILWRSHSARGPFSPTAARALRWSFALCCIDFGVAHLIAVQSVVPMVPRWIPLPGAFWAIVTGIAFLLAGLAIVSGILDVLSARLLALMLLIFSAFALAPLIPASPHNHIAWGGNAYNLAAIAAAWILASWLATLHPPTRVAHSSPPLA